MGGWREGGGEGGLDCLRGLLRLVFAIDLKFLVVESISNGIWRAVLRWQDRQHVSFGPMFCESASQCLFCLGNISSLNPW